MRVAIAGIVLGLAIMILAVGVLRGFKEEIINKQRGFAGDLTVFKYDLNPSYDNSPFVLSSEQLQKVQAIPGVKSVQPFATKPAIINTQSEMEGIVIKGIDARYDQAYIRERLLEGKVINYQDRQAAIHQVLISQTTAKRMKLGVGDSFIMYFVQEPLRKRKLEVVGIYSLGVEEVDQRMVIGSLELIQRLNEWTEQEVGAYEVKIDDFSNLSAMTQRVSDEIPFDLRVMNVQDQYPQVFKWLDLLDVNTEVIFILMLVVAVINMISALLIMILERTEMIGILKAIGLSNTGIRKVFLYQALYLIGVGLLLGNLIGLGFSYFQNKTRFFGLDESSYYVSYVPISLTFMDVVLLNLGTLVICLLALLVPSGLVSRISPVAAIKFK